ncbi:MAG: class I SAM-dependent methyltransferase [Tumebacillaceae bacterium]
MQTEHRIKLAEFWGIKEGDRILEIGCGQGDTTAVLAYMVGVSGLVHGVDNAPPEYGSPTTVGDSAAYLMRSELGQQVRMEFEVDVLAPQFEFPENSFDIVVFSHCSWYLKSHDELAAILSKVRKWGKRLAFAEWDTRITIVEQLAHFQAVLIQAQYESFKETTLANVRTLFTPNDVREIAQQAGWSITEETSIYSEELQDCRWEINMLLANYQEALDTIQEIPTKMAALIRTQVDLLKDMKLKQAVKPMSTFAFLAR